MARFREPTPEERDAWDAWVAERPEPIRKVAERFDPWSLYRLKTSGHRVTLYSLYEVEGGAIQLTVSVTGQYNVVAFERNVFGINPDDLEECELPLPGEPVGNVDIPIERIKELMDKQAKE